MTEPATQTSCSCQSVRGNPDSKVAHIPSLAASEQGGGWGGVGGSLGIRVVLGTLDLGLLIPPSKQGLYLSVAVEWVSACEVVW